MLRAVAVASIGSLGGIPESEKGQPNGVATLDGSGKIPTSQMPVGDVTYKGNWNAATNTPTLANGVGTAGDLHICDVAGTQDLGGGAVAYGVGDWLIYDGTVWDFVSGHGPAPANPSATIGLAAANGVAPTFMRSDAAPALNQAIVPTWTGAHTFTQTLSVLPAAGNGLVTTGTNSSGIPSIAAVGAAADISIAINPKGAAGVTLGGPTTVGGLLTSSSFSTAGTATIGLLTASGAATFNSSATFAGNVNVAGNLGSAANTSAPSPTNSGITIGGAPTWAMQSFYDQSNTANNRTADLLFISNSIKFRFVNDARNAFLDVFSINGGQALGVTGITSTSGSGAWEHTGSHTVLQPADVYKLWVAKSTASDTQNAPTTIGAASTYLQIGGREWKVNGFGGIGFGYVTGDTVNPPVWIGWEEKVTSSFTNGDFLVATRSTNTNVAPTERFRITAAGDAAFTSTLKTGAYTVATLPAASAALKGARAFVTDASDSPAPAWNAVVAGGGANTVPVFCNGNAWVYG